MPKSVILGNNVDAISKRRQLIVDESGATLSFIDNFEFSARGHALESTGEPNRTGLRISE
jgi:hypothetical protein